MIKELWNKLAEKAFPRIPQKNCITNYVWINREADQDSKSKAFCSVPLTLIDKAFKNAKKHPQTEFRLWIDNTLLDDKSRFFFDSHIYFSAPTNLKIHDLNDVPAYQKLDLFRKKPLGNIWARVDLARLLVQEHCFDTTEAEYVVYADFDVDNVRLESTDIARKLEKYGLLFGMTTCEALENSYMAFRRGEGDAFLKKHLIPATIEAAKNGQNGYASMMKQVMGWSIRKHVRNHAYEISAELVHPMGHIVPTDKRYTESGINQTFTPRL